VLDSSNGTQSDIQRLTRRLERERETRHKAEQIAEQGLRELYDKQRELEFLGLIAATANQSGSVFEVLGAALAHISQFAGCAASHVYLLAGRGSGQRLWPTGIWYASPHADLAGFQHATAQCVFTHGEGLPGLVWADTKPVWMEGLTENPGFLRREEAKKSGLRTAFAFPLLIDTEVVAVLEFFMEDRRAKDRALLLLMAQAGTQLGRVIERDRANDRLHDALHDVLTGLPNRANFLRRLDQAVTEQTLSGRPFCLLFIDLDHFKIVNDSLGHMAGDRLLIQVSARLAAALDEVQPGQALLARLGGDEFTILLHGVEDFGIGHAVCRRIHEAMRASFVIGEHDVFTTASIGIAASSASHGGAEAVLRNADLAMYHAKTCGKARTEIFDDAMHADAMRRITLEADLRAALRQGDFVLYYQPIISLADLSVVGFEALVRWQTAPGLLRLPGEFIELAEETGLIFPLGLWVLREACVQAQRWTQALGETDPADPAPTMSINLSARQFAQADLVEQIARILAETGVNPALIRLEITETVAMDDAARAIQVLTGLRELGVQISLDDFGTGFSSFSYLHRFPLQILKIDRSFVSRMDHNGESLNIVKTILLLARSLGMMVVAEGVETLREVKYLQEFGCDYCQGYYFEKPLPAQEAHQYLISNSISRRRVAA